MRVPMLVFAITVFSVTFTNAQEEKTATKEIQQLKSYTLTLVELRMKTPDTGQVAVEDIAKDFEKLVAAGNLIGQRHISEMSQEIATRRVSEVIRVSASLAYASGYDWCQSGAVQLTMSETVRLSVLESFPTNVLFGKSVSVTTGVSQNVNGKTRSMTQRQIGTSVKASVEPMKDKVLVKLSYQATRNKGEVKEDVALGMETINVDTSLLLEIGKRVVVASTTTSESGFLLVTVCQ